MSLLRTGLRRHELKKFDEGEYEDQDNLPF